MALGIFNQCHEVEFHISLSHQTALTILSGSLNGLQEDDTHGQCMRGLEAAWKGTNSVST